MIDALVERLADVVHDAEHYATAVLARTRALVRPASDAALLPLVSPAGGTSDLRDALATGRLDTQTMETILLFQARALRHLRCLLSNAVGSLQQRINADMHYTRGDLSALLEDVAWTYEAIATEKRVDLELACPPCGEIYADWDLLERCFSNLVENAIKYSFSSTRDSKRRYVDIRCRRHSADGHVLAVISSYGVGILPEELASGRLFTYGYRGELARRESRKGSGIGLAEANRIVMAHGGHIDIRSQRVTAEESVFVTTVTVELPPNHPPRAVQA